jgi:hypothetical protein
MKLSLFATRTGPGVTTLGAFLIICGNFLPSNGDYQSQPVPSPFAQFFLLVLVPLLLAVSIYCWFWKVRGIFLALSLASIMLALQIHCILEFVYQVLFCFDWCIPGPRSLGRGFWLPLLGYLLSGLGLLIAYVPQRSAKGPSIFRRSRAENR